MFPFWADYTSRISRRASESCLRSPNSEGKSLTQSRAKRGLQHNVPPATGETYQTGDIELAWGEKVVEIR